MQVTTFVRHEIGVTYSCHYEPRVLTW